MSYQYSVFGAFGNGTPPMCAMFGGDSNVLSMQNLFAEAGMYTGPLDGWPNEYFVSLVRMIANRYSLPWDGNPSNASEKLCTAILREYSDAIVGQSQLPIPVGPTTAAPPALPPPSPVAPAPVSPIRRMISPTVLRRVSVAPTTEPSKPRLRFTPVQIERMRQLMITQLAPDARGIPRPGAAPTPGAASIPDYAIEPTEEEAAFPYWILVIPGILLVAGIGAAVLSRK